MANPTKPVSTSKPAVATVQPSDKPKTITVAGREIKPEDLRSFGRTLHDGAGNSLRIEGNRNAAGAWTVRAKHIVMGKDEVTGEKTKTTTSGASKPCSDLADAQAAVKTIADKAIAGGWQASIVGRPGGGPKAKPDTFSIDSLPAPAAKAVKLGLGATK